MTDRMDCPDCGGTGERRIGSLLLQCEFCLGAGYVGDDNEPAEGHPPGPPPPVWEQPGADVRGCNICLGTGVVVHLGDEQPATKVVESACPECGHVLDSDL